MLKRLLSTGILLVSTLYDLALISFEHLNIHAIDLTIAVYANVAGDNDKENASNNVSFTYFLQ